MDYSLLIMNKYIELVGCVVEGIRSENVYDNIKFSKLKIQSSRKVAEDALALAFDNLNKDRKKLLDCMSSIIFNEIIFLNETVERIDKDIDELKSVFELQTCTLTDIEVVDGEAHNCGRMICILTFDIGDGKFKKIVYKPKPIERDFIINGKNNSICDANGLQTLTMLVKDDYGYIEFVEHCKEFNEKNDKDTEDALLYKLAKLDVLFNKTCTGDMHKENIIVTNCNGALSFVAIDSEVFSYAQVIGYQVTQFNKYFNFQTTRCSEYMFSEKFKECNNDKSIYNSKLAEKERFELLKAKISEIEEKKDFKIEDSQMRRLLGAKNRIVPIGTQMLCDLKDRYLKDIDKLDEVVDECVRGLKFSLSEIMTSCFSKDQEKIIEKCIKYDFMSGRECIPFFLYQYEKGMYYNSTRFENFSVIKNKL